MKKRKIKDIVSITVAVMVLLASAFAMVTIFGNDTKTISATEFSVGGLDSNGEYVKQKNTIFTEDLIECQGLVIEPEFKSTVSYKVFLYDTNKELVEATDELTGTYKLDNALVQYCRIMIIPEKSATKDFTISYFEVFKYAGELNIMVNRSQNFKLKNYFVEDDTKENMVAAYEDSDGTNVLAYVTKDGYGASELVSVENVTELAIEFRSATQPEGIEIYFYTATVSESGEVVYTYVGVDAVEANKTTATISVPQGATYMVVNYRLGERIVINQAG